MAEFITSPFALVTFGLIVLAVAIVLLVAWIVTIDRRMRGVVDGLETERRKVAEMQMVIGRRAASRGYAAPHSRQHPQSGGGAPQPRPQRQRRVPNPAAVEAAARRLPIADADANAARHIHEKPPSAR